MIAPIDKVTAFVTQKRPFAPHLLLFQHPTAGIQLPAGTVEPGESPQTAVVRETIEETQVTNLTVRLQLAFSENDLQPGERVLNQTVRARSQPDPDSLPFAYEMSRGMVVVPTGRQENGFLHIRHEEYDRLPNPTMIYQLVDGWIPETAVSPLRRRFYFWLTCADITEDSWSVVSDGGREFRPFWAPLNNLPPLVPPQAGWLTAVYDQLQQLTQSD